MFLEVRFEVGAKEKDSRRNRRAQRTETGPGLMSTGRRLGGGRRTWMCFRKPREVRGSKRRKCFAVCTVLQIGRNYENCKNAIGTSFKNVLTF